MKTAKENSGLVLQRLCGFIIDLVILIVFYGVIYLASGIDILMVLQSGTGSYVLLTLTLFVIPSVYFILLLHLLGATPGLMIFRLELVEIDTEKKPLLFISLWRYVAFYISWFSFFIGFLWIFWDSRCQSWADKLSGTVIRKKDSNIASATANDQRIWHTGKLLFYISVALMLTANILWQYEKPLDKNIVELLDDYAYDPSPASNGFYELACFSADESIDALEKGISAVERVNNSTLEHYRASGFWGPKYEVEHEAIEYNSLDSELDTLMTFVESGDYLGEVQANKELIRRNMKRYNYLEKRFDRILQYDNYRSTIFMDVFVSIPIYLPLVQFQRLYCADIALKYMDGHKKEAVERMLHSFEVNRALLKNSDTLIMKLVSVILYKFNMITCGELINYEETIDPILAEAVLKIPELNAEDLSFRKAFKKEFLMGASLLVRMVDSPKGLLDLRLDQQDIKRANPPFIKVNQILNKTYDFYFGIVELSEMSYSEFYKNYDTPIKLEFSIYDYFNNPIGTILNKTAASAVYTYYLITAKDCRLTQNLLKAAAEIRKNKLASDNIQEFLNNNSLRWGNLYQNKPLEWNSESSELFYTGPNQQENATERVLKVKQ